MVPTYFDCGCCIDDDGHRTFCPSCAQWQFTAIDQASRREEMLYEKAMAKFGAMAQIDMVVEECAELIYALQKIKRVVKHSTMDPLVVLKDTAHIIAEEVADVEIMCGQMRVMMGGYEVDLYKVRKLNRLAGLLEE